MQATLLVAFDRNHGIGLNNGLPWKLPEDLALFKTRTTSQAVIFGKTTYDNLPKKPLPNRKNIVLSRKMPATKETIGRQLVYVNSPTAAIKAASEESLHPFVCGGEIIYKLFLKLNLIDEVIASEIKGEYEVDSWFPGKALEGWDKQVIKEYEQFTIVRYLTMKQLREELDEANKKLEILRKNMNEANAKLNSYQKYSKKQYRDETDHLDYENDDWR